MLPKTCSNCESTGAYLRGGLEGLKDKHELIGDVRGMGLLQAIELVEDRASKTPAAAQTAMVMEAARQNGLLVGKDFIVGSRFTIADVILYCALDFGGSVGQLDEKFPHRLSVHHKAHPAFRRAIFNRQV